MDGLTDKIYGCLLGGLIGDAMGAPVEGKSYERIIEEYGPEGVREFEGVGTDDTAIREQLLNAIFASAGYPTVDHFAQTFVESKDKNLRKWFVPVRNAFYKFESGLSLPAYAGWGSMQSSSTAMAISPMGIINACNPRQAALEALHVASFIHNGPSGFCRDAAGAMAAAVAAAFMPRATAESIIESATRYLFPVSSRELVKIVEDSVSLAKKTGSYEAFRSRYYESYLRSVVCDSRETVPAVMAIISLSGGEPRQSILWAANFGRDADTIGTMTGGVVGALHGASGLPREWVAKVEANPNLAYDTFSERLAEVVRSRLADSRSIADALDSLA
jgi:ADP-ribosylglycohydrolase